MADSGWMPGLDGLRAIAVIAVLLFHADLGVVSGGFLGVDVFFVISGFLITTLLLRERATTGRIDVVAFWRRRARRLLPALFLLLAGVVGFTALAVPDVLVRLRVDALAALAYVTNWYLVVDHQSYFATIGRPSLLRHLWSLAVEEQFYLVWPIVLAVALAVVRRGGALVVTVLIAAASVAWTAVLFDPNADPSRVYYGTDTRLFGLLAGAVLAFAWAGPVAAARRPGRGARGWLHWSNVAAVAGLAALAWAFASTDEFDAVLYPWGSLAVALLTAGIIAMVTHPAGRIGRVLDVAPVRWIGRRSYGIYLWHWPIFTLTRPGLDVALSPAVDLALRAGLTVAIAALSYRFVEEPVRRGALGRFGARVHAAVSGGAWARAGILASAASIVVLVAAVGIRVAGATAADTSAIVPSASFQGIVSAAAPSAPAASTPPPAGAAPSIDPVQRPGDSPEPVASDHQAVRPEPSAGTSQPPVTASVPPSSAPAASEPPDASLPPVSAADPSPVATAHLGGVEAGHSPAASPPPVVAGAVPTPVATVVAPVPTAVPTAPAATFAPTAAPSIAVPAATPVAARGPIYAIGDSVMLGAATELGDALGRVEVDAVVGRQVATAISILTDRRSAGRLPGIVIVHVGDNGPVTTNQVNQLFDVLAGVPHVFVLSLHIPDDFEAHNNRLLTQLAHDRSNVTVVDWNAASAGHPELFWNDGEHLRPEGARVYAALIAATLHAQGLLAP